MINLYPSNLIENDSLTQELAAEVRVKLWQAKNVEPAETGTEAAQIQALRDMTLDGAELV
jgi:di/tripeptidase